VLWFLGIGFFIGVILGRFKISLLLPLLVGFIHLWNLALETKKSAMDLCVDCHASINLEFDNLLEMMNQMM
jgi:4-hydroxybenzoate polyprenyltransferase